MTTQHITLFQHQPLTLFYGGSLAHIHVAYRTYGTLNAQRDNAVLICHALTGDATPYCAPESGEKGWWQNFMGPGLALDTERYFFICSNVLGGCKGTTGPSSMALDGKPFGSRFPAISVQDIVEVQKGLLDALGITHLHAVIGGSFGGMQATQWAITYPHMMTHVLNLCSSLTLSPEAVGFDHVMRQAIIADPHFNNGDYYDTTPPHQGLAVARMLGMLTYRTPRQLNKAFGRAKKQEPRYFGDTFQVESYLSYQGQKFLERFDANSYLHLTRALDNFDPADGFDSLQTALSRIQAHYTLVAVASDQLFTLSDMHTSRDQLQASGVNLDYYELNSDFGHDAFLVEYDFFEPFLRKGLGQM
ncbi:homoserine O-acetyltransferase [Pasteurellaceae bacterium HPA106]|uniref:homoserine O-acetyltransferase MetX n=1 Tax=Spirabiliibacterium pneumoniae TaxID=221400 RepID=UPI001AAD5CC2|nr:homoserine O-acetyltransferase [Spirabiliibacterium pneumoniae]MBE2895545.1 homoserine O-acetyltransferase [Spirabiliibacterium pneumoniae]